MSPLIPAPDAVEVDSTNLTADQVVDHILDVAQDRKRDRSKVDYCRVQSADFA